MSNSLDPDQEGLCVGPDLGQTVCKGYQQTTKVLLARKGLVVEDIFFN